MTEQNVRISSNKKIAPDHYLLAFYSRAIAKKAEPGQFLNVRINRSYEPLLRRPFGIHRVRGSRIEILYKTVGGATRVLSSKKKGQLLDVLGPLGKGFDSALCISTDHGLGLKAKKGPASTGNILVAGGHGVAPLLMLAEKLITKKAPLFVFIGAATSAHIIRDKEFKKLGAKVYIATEDGSRGFKGLVTQLLTKRLKSVQKQPAPIYACGPSPMLKAISVIAKRLNVPCQISIEERMACGIGTCLGCAVKTVTGYKMVCKDGPVFNSGDITWQ